MTSKSQELLAKEERYNRIERHADAFGRVIGVKRLKPSEQLKVQELAPNLNGTTTIEDDNGKEVQVLRSTPLFLAACVREIGDLIFPFPRTRSDLDAVLDLLDQEGLEAAAKGLAALEPDLVKKPDENKPDGQGGEGELSPEMQQAKN